MLIYGIDVMTIMTEMLAYREALGRKDQVSADAVWKRLTKVADKLDSYYIPIHFEQPGAGLVSRDALTRSQLRDCINRCRRQRKEI